MRGALVTLLLSSWALADVGPRPAACTVPASCQRCSVALSGDAGVDCVLSANDAGLLLSGCTDRAGSIEQQYFCPPGVTATRPTTPMGCQLMPGAALVAVAAVVALRRRR